MSKIVKDKIWAGEYWGESGALAMSLRNFSRSVREVGFLSAVITRVSDFYSATSRAKKELDTVREEKAEGKEIAVWKRRYRLCGMAMIFWWTLAFPFAIVSLKKLTSGQCDVMGTVALRLGWKCLARTFFLKALLKARWWVKKNSVSEYFWHEEALALCGLLETAKSDERGYVCYMVLCSLLLVEKKEQVNANQHARVLRRVAEYERKSGRMSEAVRHLEEAEKLSIGADQKRKLELS